MDQNYKNIMGWMSDREAELLFDLAKESPSKRMLEIGTFCGKSAVVLAEAVDGGTLICVDFFANNARYSLNGNIVASTLNDFWKNMENAKLQDRVLAVKGDAKTITSMITGKFGMIYIDGGHTMIDILPNTLWAWDHLLPNGIVAFHDYTNQEYPDIKLVVDTLATKWGVQIYKQADGIVALKKNNNI